MSDEHASGTTSGEPLVFEDHQQSRSFTPGPNDTANVVSEGVATASGLVTGSFDLLDHALLGPGDGLHIDRVLRDPAGTIAIRMEARFAEVTDTTETVEGTWTVTGGTGRYAGLRGKGTYGGTVTRATETVDGRLDGFGGWDSARQAGSDPR